MVIATERTNRTTRGTPRCSRTGGSAPSSRSPEDVWDRHQPVHHSHDNPVERPDISGDEPNGEATADTRDGDQRSDDERDSRAMNRAREHISPVHVGAEPELPGRRAQAHGWT